MNYAACRTAWTVPGGIDAARTLDSAFPQGACEVFSLAAPQRTSVPDDEFVARILTSPGDYDLNLGELLTSKLTSTYASGVSLIRTGASDQEIFHVVSTLMNGAGVQALVGAIVLQASEIRCANKLFCVYDTDAPGLTMHADIVGTFDRSMSKSAWKKEESRRRRNLRDRMAPRLVRATSPPQLLVSLRQAGI